MVILKVSDFFEGNSLPNDLQTSPCLGLKIFWMVSLQVSDFFEGNSTSMTLTKFDDHQNSPCLGHKIFLDGLTESVRLFWGKFYVMTTKSHFVWALSFQNTENYASFSECLSDYFEGISKTLALNWYTKGKW